MAIIPQQRLFGWREIENLGELERLRLVLEYMPDGELMVELERERANGRDDYPIRAVWNSVLAGIVYQHPSIESLRRELLRNAQLRELCGFDLVKGEKAVPPSWVYSRFLGKLLKKEEKVEGIFYRLVEELREELPGFGEVAAIDGKALASLSKGKKKEKVRELRPDGRRERDADWGCKVYRGKREDGSRWEKVVKWFGFRLHLIVDAIYELPLGFKVTKASASEVKEAPKLLEKLKEKAPGTFERMEYLIADKAYDSTELIIKLWEEYQIKPVIDIRNQWKDGEETKLITGQENVVYDYKGKVYCYCPETGKKREMAYGGFEKDRETLKYRCPARHYGLTCKGIDRCPVKSGIRIPLKEDRRVFTPLARSSYRWQELYKNRTAVERVNSRLDQSFGFEQHFIRGLKKMSLRCALALAVMLAMALGRIREKKGENLRSLVKAA
jgi:hypothetical protein